MGKSLAKKLAPIIFAGLSLFVTGCNEQIEADGSKFIYNKLSSESWDIKEIKKDGTIITYYPKWHEPNKLGKIEVDGEGYTSYDSLVWKEAEKGYKFAKKIRREKHALEKEALRQERLEKGLEAFY